MRFKRTKAESLEEIRDRYICPTVTGKRWQKRNLTGDARVIARLAGIPDELQLRDLRRTAATEAASGSRRMAYRVNAQFKDGSTNGALADVVAATPPRPGDIVSVGRHGEHVPLQVIAVWTPSSRPPFRHTEGLVTVEAREI